MPVATFFSSLLITQTVTTTESTELQRLFVVHQKKNTHTHSKTIALPNMTTDENNTNLGDTMAQSPVSDQAMQTQSATS